MRKELRESLNREVKYVFPFTVPFVNVLTLLEDLNKTKVSAHSYFEAGIACYGFGHRKQAVSAFLKAIKANTLGGSDSFFIHACLGYVYHVYGFTSTALEQYSLAAKFANNVGAIDKGLLFELRSCILNSRRQYQEAIVESTLALQLHPTARAHASKGFSLVQLQRFTQSIEHLDKAISLNPTYAKAYAYKAWVFCASSRYSEALELCNKAISISECPDNYYIRARAHCGLNSYSKATADLATFISIESTPRLFSVLHAKRVQKDLKKNKQVEF